MNKKSIFLILTALSLTALFQNCNRANFSTSSNQISRAFDKVGSGGSFGNDNVVDQTHLYTKIHFQEHDSRFGLDSMHRIDLSLGLINGALTLQAMNGARPSATEAAKSCALDDMRLREFNTLLTSSQICSTEDNSHTAAMHCMAIAISDIQLINEASNQIAELRPDICQNGIHLCGDGTDAKFRTMLTDLIQHPPVDCK